MIRHDGGDRFFVKLAAGPASFTRATFAYRHAVPRLGAGRAPRLAATSAQHLALIVTAVPGTALSRLQLSDSALETAYRKAGALLALLHQAGKLTRSTHQQASTSLRRTADRAEQYVEAAGEHLSAEQRKLVMVRAVELRLLDRLPLGYIHGNAQADQWMWAGPRRPMALTGFGYARFAAVVEDFALMACGAWAEQPRLKSAFLAGYGRRLSDEEKHALVCLTALHATTFLARGAARGHAAVAEHGRRLLDRLVQEAHA
ncbi:phosphotransferase [Streptomyces sp. NPDC051913]|uniref:phosphotransferase n=1 Tax=Streptomyces sp. NPDC051913 TaxID=3365676 RepID=UPI0037CEFD6F